MCSGFYSCHFFLVAFCIGTYTAKDDYQDSHAIIIIFILFFQAVKIALDLFYLKPAEVLLTLTPDVV